ncbi:MAG: hypothetical protein H0V51_00925 [Chloroflexi bacterium]|nr:hypothetical protein [Chloroflexota bacterium]
MSLRAAPRSGHSLLLAALLFAVGALDAAASDECLEPNGSVLSPCKIQSGSPTIGTIASPDDKDLYVLDLPKEALAPGALTVRVTATLGDLPGNYDLTLFQRTPDGQGIEQVTGSENDGSEAESIEA